MVRFLLEDRFKMVSHFETKEADGWVLTVAKGGPKIHEFKDGDPAPPFPDWVGGKPADRAAWDGVISATLPEVGVAAVTGRRVSMLQLCGYLERSLGTVVWDETGMKGNYYIAFRYAREDAPMDAAAQRRAPGEPGPEDREAQRTCGDVGDRPHRKGTH
jgi:uncharacterized protein (TIGR03435 family)